MAQTEIMRLVDFILKWQTLIGSIIGGLAALATALIVARSARHRDEQASGMIVTATLAAVCVVSETLADLSSQEGVTEENFPLWFAEKVAHSHPSMPVLFDASAARLMSVDVSLAAHLSLFQQSYSQTESVLKRVADDYTYYHMHGKMFRPQDLMKADCRIVAKHFQFASEHAKCAVYLISELVLSRLSFWHRLRRHICHNKKEKECMEVLRKGTS
jgi:hypothetical protein